MSFLKNTTNKINVTFYLVQVEKMVYIKGMRTGERMLFAKVSYNITVDVGGQKIQCKCRKEQTVMLPTVDPFDVNVKLASMQVENQHSVVLDFITAYIN